MSADGRASPHHGRFYSLAEADEAVLGPVASILHTAADVVLLLLYADPRPIVGRDRQEAQVFLAIREVLPEGHVEPVEFEQGRSGPRSGRLAGIIDQLSFANYVELSGWPRRDLQLAITPKGRAYTAARFDALPAGVGEKLAQKRLEWDTLTPDGMARYVLAHGLECGKTATFKGGHAGSKEAGGRDR